MTLRTVKLALVALFCLAPLPAGAAALPPSTPDPAAFETNGTVNAIARGGGLTFIGGDFTQLQARTGPAVRFSPVTGRRVAPVAEVAPPGAAILASAPDGAGGYFIGGFFSEVGGLARNNLAHILPSGNVDPAFNPDPNGTVRALAVSGGAVFAGGDFTQIGGEPRDQIAKLSATSGNAFSGFNPDADGIVDAIAVSGSSVYAGGEFTDIGGQPRSRIAKLSATSGNAFSGFNPGATGGVRALAVSDGALFVGGAFSGVDSIGGEDRDRIAKLSATSGTVSSTFDPGASGGVLALAATGSELYVGGSFDGVDSIGGEDRDYIAKLSTSDGAVSPTFNPDAENSVQSLALAGSALYAGGAFDTIGGQPRNALARLSTTSGNAFATFDSNVAGAASEASTVSISGGTIFAGGNYSAVNGVTRSRIAALDSTGAPTAFNAGTVDAPVRALALDGSGVYAGGDFTTIGGQARNRVAKLSATTGNAFSGFNPDANNPVFALAADGTNLYVGGNFTQIGSQFRNRIAKLSGTSGNAFSTFNPDANNIVQALAVSGGALYVGGDFNGFNSIGGQTRERIAKLSTTSGNAFSGFNPGADESVRALLVSGSALYAGGGFLNIGGQSRNRIAKLSTTSGNAFSAFNPNSDKLVSALAFDGSSVYAGGFFGNIGGQPRNRLAALQPTTGAAIAGFNPNLNNLAVNALSASASTLYAGGDFTQIGGKQRRGYAQFGP